MKGFDKEFTDFEDYILRITDRIWKEKNIGSISRYYAKDAIIHTLGGPVSGSDDVINNTINTLAAFPDRLLNAEDVIWSGNDEDGYYSSHRIISPAMTNSGHSEFGPPTGKQATVRTIADCAVKNNQVYEEWLMRDNMGIVQQLGMDPHYVAKQLADKNRDHNALHSWLHTEIERVKSAEIENTVTSLPDPFSDCKEFIHCIINALWLNNDSLIIEQAYTDSSVFLGPSGREMTGPEMIQERLGETLAVLDQRHISIDHVCSLMRKDNELDIAIRWVMTGVHDKDGIYGSATGKNILILAASHWHIVDGVIVQDWTVFDELAVLRQVYHQ